jgi:hypothetical protein
MVLLASSGNTRAALALPRLFILLFVALLLQVGNAHKVQDERHGHMARLQSYAVRSRISLTLGVADASPHGFVARTLAVCGGCWGVDGSGRGRRCRARILRCCAQAESPHIAEAAAAS